MRRHILLLVSIVFTSSIFGQTLKQKAEHAYKNRDYYNSTTYYQKLLETEKDKKSRAVYSYRIAEGYRASLNYTDAIKWYESAIKNGYTDSKTLCDYSTMLIMTGNYVKAKEKLNELLSANPKDSLAKLMLASCDYATTAQAEKVYYTVRNEMKMNTKYSDYGAVMLSDTSVIFASSRIDDPLTDKIYEFNSQGFSDFYVSSLSPFDKTWKKGQKCVGGLNSPFNDGTMYYDKKTATGYFMQCNGLEGKDNRCGIYTSQYNQKANKWSPAQPFAYQNTDYSTGHPTMNKAGDMLIFVSDMPSGKGGKDLWMVKKTGDTWGIPENMGARFNTKGDEMFPYLLNDSILYFSSNGWPGFGGLDIFYVNLKNKDQKEPINLKYPFNSGADDFSIYFKDENMGFFTSNRPGGVGDDDIYSFASIPITLLAKGVVKLKGSEEFIPDARVYIKGSDGHIDSTRSDAQGRYVFTKLDVNVDYAVVVKKPGYFGDAKSFTTKGINKSALIAKSSGYDIDLMLDMTFALEKISKDEIKISNIFYDLDKSTLREESKPELMKLVTKLKDNPEVCIMLNSHTDARGSAAHNDKLSKDRALSCMNFLISQGIDPKRLKYKGWGSRKLEVKDAKTEEEHQVNRRTTFMVTNASQLESMGQTGLEFKIQVAASKTELTDKGLAKVKAALPDMDIETEKGDDGYFKYMVGSYKKFEETAPIVKKLKTKGVTGFVVGYNNGVKIDLEEAKKLQK